MNHFTILLILVLLFQGCKDYERSQDSQNGNSRSRITFSEHVEKNGELTFTDSSQSESSILENGGACILRFSRTGEVVFSSFAYNICKYQGVFREVNGDILITFDMKRNPGEAFLDRRIDLEVIHLPPLNLQDTSGGLALIRADGRADFKEHWNIYPDAIEKIFPFRIAASEHAQN
jgi:hypothetical protein